MSFKSTSRPQLISYITLILSILLGISGQLLMKQAMTFSSDRFLTQSFIQQLVLALGVYTVGVMNWIFALRSVKLSIAYPLTSLNYVGILLGSHYFFKEEITTTRIAGVMLVFTGILFVVLGGKEIKQQT